MYFCKNKKINALINTFSKSSSDVNAFIPKKQNITICSIFASIHFKYVIHFIITLIEKKSKIH